MFNVKVFAVFLAIHLVIQIVLGMDCDSTPTVDVAVKDIVNINWYLFREKEPLGSNCTYIRITPIATETSGTITFVPTNFSLVQSYSWLSYENGLLVYQLLRTDPNTINNFNILVFEKSTDGAYMAVAICKPGTNYAYLWIYSTNRSAPNAKIESIKAEMENIHDDSANVVVDQSNCVNDVSLTNFN
ncbi:hypothetical protein CHUAL_013773 [Chamberlinius hualienensis]